MVLMGVAGCGKSTVGVMLAARLGAAYLDGDDLHPSVNIEKMSRGVALTDEDRWPWLTRVGEALIKPEGPLIVGCSALKRAYRDHILETADAPVTFIHLAGTSDVINARMNDRKGHFMPPALLASQFAALEPPEINEKAINVNIDRPLVSIVDTIVAQLEGMENGK
ncbi:gluconokinase [Rhizobium tibeticum]|uniref:gluconokinase n=1 Tax=Rhizobium tibeticum TaxID=501024 RepID=UPI0027D8BAD3|nr:gluconokinase [Rhizobium tibeticum]